MAAMWKCEHCNAPLKAPGENHNCRAVATRPRVIDEELTQLTNEERIECASVGGAWEMWGTLMGIRQRYGIPKAEGWKRAVEHACAECFVAKNLRVKWQSRWIINVNEEGYHLVAGAEVKHADSHSKLLILHGPENLKHASVAERPYILVTGPAWGFMRIQGWRFGRDYRFGHFRDPKKERHLSVGKKVRWPAHFIRHEDLFPISELPKG